MGKADDIPQDVWDAALGLAETCAFDGYTVRKETNLTDAWAVVDELNAVLIARAILAEREAAATCAEEIGKAYAEDETGWLECSEAIAAAIRKGSD